MSERLEQAKRASIGQRLLRCARLFNERALARVREKTGVELRVVHTSLFPHIDLGGTRLTDLARRLGTSKQAAGQLVDELVEMGVLERTPDPTDGRARLVRFVGGADALLVGIAELIAVEREAAETMGTEAVQALDQGLTALEKFLASPTT